LETLKVLPYGSHWELAQLETFKVLETLKVFP